MADQIEKVVTGYNNEEPLPVAGTDQLGIAKFAEDDFLVDSQGRVEALTKWGIAHILNYRGANDVARMYDITTSFGKQLPKVGDVGLVLSDQVNPSVNDADTQIGKIVRLTAIQTDATTPIVYYGENLGSIAGPQGIQGPVGKTGAMQHLVSNATNTMIVTQSFTKDKTIHAGDVALVVEGNQNDKIVTVGSVIKITNFSNITILGYELVGNIRGPQGTKYVTAIGTEVVGDENAYQWTPTTASDVFVVGDYAISAQSSGQIQRGDIFKIIQIVNGKAQSIKLPTISVAQMQLGIWAVSDKIVSPDGTQYAWAYSPVPDGLGLLPLVGNLALCIDDSDLECFGKLYTITEVTTQTGSDITRVVTSNVGSDLRGPVQDISIGDVTTVPNDETGAAGQASVSMTEVDRLHKQISLAIPVGPQGKQGIEGKTGPQGVPGPAGVANVNARGAYDSTVAYVQNDLVYFDTQYTNEVFGGSYIRTENLPNEAGLTPKDNPTAWGLFVAEGAPGKDGAIGPVGPAGANGKNGVFNAILGSVKNSPSTGDMNIEWEYLYIQPGFRGTEELIAITTEAATFNFGPFGTHNVDKGTIVRVTNIANSFAKVTIALSTPTSYIIAHLTDPIEYVTITNPSTATEGNLTNTQFATLQASRENKIIFDNEIYTLNDQGHDQGYNVYTHVGHNSQNRFAIKCITVNANNKSWTLTEYSLGNNVVNLGNGNASSGNLTQAEWDILHENVDAVIELGDDVYRYAYSDSQSTSGGTLMRDVFVGVLPYDLTPGGVTITQTSTKFVVCSGTGTGQYPYSWSRQGIASPAKKYLHNLTVSNIYGDIVYAQVVNTRKEKYIIFDDTIGSIPATGIIVEGVVPNNVIYTVVGLYWDESNAVAKIRYINASTKLIGTKSILSATIVDNVMEL